MQSINQQQCSKDLVKNQSIIDCDKIKFFFFLRKKNYFLIYRFKIMAVHNYSLASSYDPLYPLSAPWWICRSIYDLFDIPIHQFMLRALGQMETFPVLQHRLEKVCLSNVHDIFFVD